MLIQFRFENYKSFKDDTILDMTAIDKTDNSSAIIDGNENILPVAVIFGANASGKSNILEALDFMAQYVINSFAFGSESRDDYILKSKPFRFNSESIHQDSSFEVYFSMMVNGRYKQYNYGFVVGKDGVTEEWLNYKTKSSKKFKRIFYRENEKVFFDKYVPKKSQDNIHIALEKETLVVSLGAKLKIAKFKEIRDWFMGICVTDFGNPYENVVLSSNLPKGFVENQSVREDVVNYLNTFDKSIVGLEIRDIQQDEKNRKKIAIDAVHISENGDFGKIPLSEESSGTLKMFSLYPFLKNVLSEGGVLVVDELNSKLHPLLVRMIILMFKNKSINTNKAQLICSSHDIWQLSNDFLQRDEVWLVSKEKNGVSELTSLIDYDDDSKSIEKDYMLGNYGAIPELSANSLWGGNDNV